MLTATEKKLTSYANRNVTRKALGINSGYDNNQLIIVNVVDGFGKYAYRPLAGDCYGHTLGKSGKEAMATLRKMRCK